MITFKDYLSESINDAGILKAVFVVGIPGAGKSYTVSKLKGAVSPLIVNTDRATEYLSRKLNIPANDQTWKIIRDDARRITTSQLFNYLNGMLPLFVDGTSNDASNILSRAGILESIGYDVGMVFINTSLETALERAAARGKAINRTVNPQFITSTYKLSQDNKKYFQGKFDFFKEINNDPGELTDEVILKAYRAVSNFYTQPLDNVVGKRLLKSLNITKEKYLVPTIFEEDALQKKCKSWYKN